MVDKSFVQNITIMEIAKGSLMEFNMSASNILQPLASNYSDNGKDTAKEIWFQCWMAWAKKSYLLDLISWVYCCSDIFKKALIKIIYNDKNVLLVKITISHPKILIIKKILIFSSLKSYCFKNRWISSNHTVMED